MQYAPLAFAVIITGFIAFAGGRVAGMWEMSRDIERYDMTLFRTGKGEYNVQSAIPMAEAEQREEARRKRLEAEADAQCEAQSLSRRDCGILHSEMLSGSPMPGHGIFNEPAIVRTQHPLDGIREVSRIMRRINLENGR